VSNTKFGRKFEKTFAEKIGARATIGSGSLWFQKEDVIGKNWLFQCKATKNDYFVLRLEDINMLINNAKKTERSWGFVVEFGESGVLDKTAYVVLPFPYIEKVPPKFQAYTLGSGPMVKGKQIKLTRDDLDSDWMNNTFTTISFDKLEHVLFVMNEMDFVSAYGGSINGN
jgi:hypothetical protein